MNDRLINNYEDWLSDFRNQKIDINSSRIDLMNMANANPSQYVQNLIDNGMELNRRQKMAAKYMVGKQGRQARKFIDKLDKSAGIGAPGTVVSEVSPNLHFSSQVGELDSIVKGMSGGLSREQAEHIITNTANSVYKDLGFENIPLRINMQYGNGFSQGNSLIMGNSKGNGLININVDNMIYASSLTGGTGADTAHNLADTVAHEMRHAWQQHYDNKAYRQAAENYVSGSDGNFDAYFEQPIEVDARNYGKSFADTNAQRLYEETLPKPDAAPLTSEIPSSSPYDLPDISLDFGGPTLENTTRINDRMINNYNDWLSDYKANEISGYTSYLDVLEKSNIDADKYVQNLIDNGGNFSGKEIDAIKKAMVEEKRLADFVIDKRMENLDLGSEGIVKSLQNDNLHFSMNIGEHAEDMKNLAATLSPEEAYDIITNAADIAYKDLNLGHVPTRINVNYGTLGKQDSFGNQAAGLININVDSFLTVGNKFGKDKDAIIRRMTNTVAHELRHTWQQEYDNANHQKVARNYIRGKDDYEGYKNQYTEIDARDYGKNFSKKHAADLQQQAEAKYAPKPEPGVGQTPSGGSKSKPKQQTARDTTYDNIMDVYENARDVSNTTQRRVTAKEKRIKEDIKKSRTLDSGGGGGKKPPENKSTASPEPPEKGSGDSNKKKTVEAKRSQRQNRRNATKDTNKINQAPETKAQPEIKPDAKINAEKQVNKGAKIKKGTSTLKSNSATSIKDTAGINVTESTRYKMKYDITGKHPNGTMSMHGAIDDTGKLAYLNATDNTTNTVYNLLGKGTSKGPKESRINIESSKAWKDLVNQAGDYGIDVPRWAKGNYRQREGSEKVYRPDEVTKEIENIGHNQEVPDYIDNVFNQKDPDGSSKADKSKGGDQGTTTKPEPEKSVTENGPQGPQGPNIYTEEGQRKLANDKIEALEERYNNGDLSDDEYIEELNKIYNDHLKPNPIDDSNVLNKSSKPGDPVTPESIYEDFLNNNQNIFNNKTSPNPIDNSNIDMSNVNTQNLNNSLNDMLEEEKRLRQNRIYEQEDYDRQKQAVIDKFNDGDISQQEMYDMIDELDKRFKPLTSQEVQDYIDAASDPNVRDPGNPFHVDVDGRNSTIEKHFKGDGYEGNVKNGYVQDIEVDGEKYTVKTRSDDGTIDIFDSSGTVVVDPKITKDINAKVFDESQNFYKNLTDDEWNTVFENASDYRFDAHKVSDSVSKADAKMLNMNDAIDKRQSILAEQRKEVQDSLDNAKGKKKKKAITDRRNQLDIKKLEAEKIKQANMHKLKANKQRRQATDKFKQTLGLDAFEAGSDEYKQALKALKGTAEYDDAMKVFKEELDNIRTIRDAGIAGSNKILDSQIKGLMGKGLTLNNMITIGSAAIGAVNKYKESRAEGKGVVSSAARAGATAVAAEVMGPTASVLAAGAKMAGNAAVELGDALYKENRRMNSMSNFTPLGGVNFQDSQELATMRQSGMELAKMSQYNLEQTLMGAEAKHLHR